MEFCKDKEMLCIECDELNRKSTCLEVRYDALVEKLKNKLCSVIFMNQEEENLEVEDTMKEIDDEFSLDARCKYFDESEECMESEEKQKMNQNMKKVKKKQNTKKTKKNMNMKVRFIMQIV